MQYTTLSKTDSVLTARQNGRRGVTYTHGMRLRESDRSIIGFRDLPREDEEVQRGNYRFVAAIACQVQMTDCTVQLRPL